MKLSKLKSTIEEAVSRYGDVECYVDVYEVIRLDLPTIRDANSIKAPPFIALDSGADHVEGLNE